MQLSIDLIYYHLKKHYPDLYRKSGDTDRKITVSRPAFATDTDQKEDKLLLVSPQHVYLIPHLKNQVVICAGFEDFVRHDSRTLYLITPSCKDPLKLFNELLDICDRLSQLIEEMEQAVREKVSYQALIRTLDGLIDDPIAMTDHRFRYIGWSQKLAKKSGYEKRYVNPERYVPIDVINELSLRPEFKELEKNRDVFPYFGQEELLHKNLFDHDTYIGRLFIPCPEEEDKRRYYSELLRLLAGYVEALYSTIGTFWHNDESDRRIAELLNEQLEGRLTDLAKQKELNSLLPYAPEDDFYLICLQSTFTSDTSRLGKVLAGHLFHIWPGSFCFKGRDRFLILLNHTRYEKQKPDYPFFQELAVFLRDSLLTASISRSFKNLELSTALFQAEAAYEIGKKTDPTFWYYKFDDYAFSYLKLHGIGNHPLKALAAKELIDLLAYDRKNSTELYHTYKTYMDVCYNALEASRHLNIARATFLKRMDRIHALTGLSACESLEKRAYLALSFCLLSDSRSL